MNEAFELVRLRHGAMGVRSVRYGEVCHPGVGAREEADRVYVEGLRLRERMRETSEEFVIWDVGLGCGANALAAIGALAEVGGRLRVVSFDFSFAPLEFAEKHAETLGYLGGMDDVLGRLMSAGRVEFEKGALNVEWTVVLGDFARWVVGAEEEGKGGSRVPAPHAILWDPHSPVTNPEMWSVDVFAGLFRRLERGRPCGLATYSRSTAIRVALLLSGFWVGAGVGTKTKEETTVAANVPEMMVSALDRRWLERVRRSGAAEPWVGGERAARPASEATWCRLNAHPQFAAKG